MYFLMVGKTINLKIATLNAQSLNTGRDELVRTTEKNYPDILAITETRLNMVTSIVQYNIAGYRFHNKPRGTGRNLEGGVIGFYARSKFNVKLINVPSNELEQRCNLKLIRTL